MPRRALFLVLKLLLTLSIPPFLLLTNINLLTSNAFLRYEYGKADFPPAPDFSSEERLSVAEKCILYLRSDADIALLGELENEKGALFREGELAHMVDVKVLMRQAFAWQRILGVSIVLSLFLFLLKQEARKGVPLCLTWGSLIALILPVLVAALAYLNFDRLFTRFHQLFFAAGTWTFDPSDTLIQLFPICFWFDTFRLLALLTISEAALLGAAMYWVHKLILRRTG